MNIIKSNLFWNSAENQLHPAPSHDLRQVGGLGEEWLAAGFYLPLTAWEGVWSPRGILQSGSVDRAGPRPDVAAVG